MNKQAYFKTIISVALLIVLMILVAVMILKKEPQEIPSPYTNVTSDSVTNTSAQPQIEGDKVPEGWYTHETYGMASGITVLSRTKELPNDPTAERINISTVWTSLSPEDFIPRQGLVGGSLNSSNADWSWGVYKGHETFTMTVNADDAAYWFVYVFGGGTVYEFTLSPNNETNPNLEKDREDFWKVITYYVQQPSFEKLLRTETQQNCKTAILSGEQERNIQVEPETGYVVVNYIEGNKRKYVFFNYNDDLSQCEQNLKTFLENAKKSAKKLPQ